MKFVEVWSQADGNKNCGREQNKNNESTGRTEARKTGEEIIKKSIGERKGCVIDLDGLAQKLYHWSQRHDKREKEKSPPGFGGIKDTRKGKGEEK